MKKLFVYNMFMLCVFATANSHAQVNWSEVKTHSIELFYPGQASWEWLLTKHSGKKSVRKGGVCQECHEGEEKQMGPLIAQGKKLEPTPIAGKPGYVKAQLQAAYDTQNIYLRMQWQDPGFSSGQKMDKNADVKLAVMFDDGNVKEAGVAGCWGVCHDDSTGMASHAGKSRSLYVSASREKLTRTGGGDAVISADELEDLLDQGIFMEFWQATANNGQVNSVSNGYILETRHKNKNAYVSAKASLANGTWTMEFTRQRQTGDRLTKAFKANNAYVFGFALHDDYVKGRFHYISFGKTIGIDTSKADIVAKKL